MIEELQLINIGGTYMKTLIATLTLTATMSTFAFQTGSGANGPWTIGPLGYTDPAVTSRGSEVSLAGTSGGALAGNSSAGTTVGSLASLNMRYKAVALQIQNDTQNYFQTGEMTVLLKGQVENIMGQNAALSEDEAVSIVLEFAELHLK